MTRWHRQARRAADWAIRSGRRAGVGGYHPERWTTDQWDGAYDAGTLRYYCGLDELARYSLIVGYIGWHRTRNDVQPARILDVGCGTGILRGHLDDDLVSEYVGVDLSVLAVRAAEAAGHPRSRFVVGDATSLDIGRFDIIVLNEVLYYVRDATEFLEQLRPKLQPGGVLVVSMWRHPGDRLLWRTVDATFPLLDRVDVRNRANPINGRGWRVGCFAPAGPGGTATR